MSPSNDCRIEAAIQSGKNDFQDLSKALKTKWRIIASYMWHQNSTVLPCKYKPQYCSVSVLLQQLRHNHIWSNRSTLRYQKSSCLFVKFHRKYQNAKNSFHFIGHISKSLLKLAISTHHLFLLDSLHIFQLINLDEEERETTKNA